MKNIESKFACQDHDRVLAAALECGADDHGVLEQVDRFFVVERGRLKLRVEGGRGILIAYHRADMPGPGVSEYKLFSAADPDSLAAVLGRVLDAGLSVRKRRRLLIIDHTRVHLDEVEGLGRFVELETVVDAGAWDPRAEHAQLVEPLRLARCATIAEAYADLLGEPADWTAGFNVEVRQVDPRSPEALAALRRYVGEMFQRGVWFGTPDETEEVDDFQAPKGAFVVAGEGQEVIGCGGLRMLDPTTREIKRMWVDPARRRSGIASMILSALEEIAARLGFDRLRLDTNEELAEALAFYRRHGFVDIERYNDAYDATHFLEKRIDKG